MPNIRFQIEFELIEKDDSNWRVFAAGKLFRIWRKVDDEGRETFHVFSHYGAEIPFGNLTTFDEAFAVVKTLISSGDRVTAGSE